ncbi:MAG: glycerophosphodiester phosphodiesterase [Actinomycetota bacterium]
MAFAFLATDTPFGFAHRGGVGGGPENTEAAFAHAVDLGFDYLETDVHATADGVLVAFHDDELERVAGLPGGIEDYPWSRLADVRLAGDHPIPRLADLLARFPSARFNIDPKADAAVPLLIDTIREYEALDRVCIGSFSDDRIARVRAALGPALCTAPGPKGVARVLDAAVRGGRWRPPYGCLQIPARGYRIPLDSGWLIGRVKRLGLQVHFWTINDEAEMARLLDRGADALITDETARLRTVLMARGQWPDRG